jgi:hypothetical protein
MALPTANPKTVCERCTLQVKPRDAVSPAAVEVDIGCGMSAVRTSLKVEDLPDNLPYLRGRLERAVPVGFGKHKSPVDPSKVFGLPQAGWKEFWRDFEGLAPSVRSLRARAEVQMGTLGGATIFWRCAPMTRASCGWCCTPGRATSARSWPSTTSKPGRLFQGRDTPNQEVCSNYRIRFAVFRSDP